jgi:hypothetical protein
LILDDGAGDSAGELLCIGVSGEDSGVGFVVKCRVLSVDDKSAGDGVAPLQGGLRATEHFHAIDIPQICLTKDKLIISEGPTIELGRNPRPCAGDKGDYPFRRGIRSYYWI